MGRVEGLNWGEGELLGHVHVGAWMSRCWRVEVMRCGGEGSWIRHLARMRKKCRCYLPSLLADLLWWVWAFKWLVAGSKEMEECDAT